MTLEFSEPNQRLPLAGSMARPASPAPNGSAKLGSSAPLSGSMLEERLVLSRVRQQRCPLAWSYTPAAPS